jgi:hypothetical protein
MVEAFKLAVICFPIYVLLSILVMRSTSSKRFVPKTFWTAIVYFMAMSPFFFKSGLADGFFSLAISFSLWSLLIFILVCSQNSVTLRMLDEIDLASDQPLTEEKLLKQFSDEESIRARLETMAQNQYIEIALNGKIQLTPKAYRISRLNLFFRHVFSI